MYRNDIDNSTQVLPLLSIAGGALLIFYVLYDYFIGAVGREDLIRTFNIPLFAGGCVSTILGVRAFKIAAKLKPEKLILLKGKGQWILFGVACLIILGVSVLALNNISIPKELYAPGGIVIGVIFGLIIKFYTKS